VDLSKDAGELVAWHMQQTGARPDAVIGLVPIQLVEPHRLDGMTKTHTDKIDDLLKHKEAELLEV